MNSAYIRKMQHLSIIFVSTVNNTIQYNTSLHLESSEFVSASLHRHNDHWQSLHQ